MVPALWEALRNATWFAMKSGRVEAGWNLAKSVTGELGATPERILPTLNSFAYATREKLLFTGW
ncbi:hypothetical protein R69927_02385 [Paraburkholderia domus]|jgi:hypothetical protein|uniref:Uncharacterized protein n=1 Tax=Paraburkholderia domus TaxID=2793075 RepID=A0A9N8QZW1_9BURK|nr:hypothetical protein R75483_02247 [Paraburkholderia domus]CAE6781907.1 hypothetical protein R70006_04443 [Paraburkholderia domus]CAE6805886.1 hypothetical protein R69749_02840 [Paraburkholderia domus]CAE6856956.1 hypothetical protein R69927_02385 [Paraburkholderia domus]CAE6888060.1 hypothetical protein R70199_02942 [Paraburkholderia domus]